MTTIKTILAAASGGSASVGAVEVACRLARRFGAHVEGFHAKPDPFELLQYGTGIGSGFTDTFIEKFNADAAAAAAKVKADFLAALGRHGMDLALRLPEALPGGVGASAAWHEETGYGPARVAARARFFDLAVLGRSERVLEHIHSDTVEEVLIQSGRPVLLAPARSPKSVGDRVAFGWNGSAEAVRAMAGGLPFLATAHETVVLSIGERHDDSVGSLIDYLAWHDVKTRHIRVSSHIGMSVGHQLLQAATAEGSDLLVMGGYGHTQWREFIFGGATREAIGSGALPILMTH